MTRHALLPAALVAAFLGGARLAGGAPRADAAVEELLRRHQTLVKDLRKIEQACKDILEIREMRESGKYVLNAEERKMERQGRLDFHIFMERYRNDTLQTLEILDRLVAKEDYVDPVRRLFGKSLDEIVRVDWEEQPVEDVIAEIGGAYGVPLHVSGEIDYRKTVSLHGEMSLLSILLYLENVADARMVYKDGNLWFERIPREPAPEAGDSADR